MSTDIKKFSVSSLKPAPFIDFLFSSPKMAWLWLIVRVWLGYQWVISGYEKMINRLDG